VGLQDAAAIVREIHEHEDGTLIAPPKQTPDPEEIREKRRPSLGEILLREAEAMKAEREAERQAEARQKAAAEAKDQPVSIMLPQIHAVAAPSSDVILSGAQSAESKDPREQSSREALRQQGPPFTVLANDKQWTNLAKHRGRWQPGHREQSFHLV
jgi:hypothetical protein